MSSRSDLLVFVLLIVCSYLVISTKCQACDDTSPYWQTLVTVICKNVSNTFPSFKKTVGVIKCLDCNIPVVDEHTIINFKGDTFNLSYSHVQNISSTAFKPFVNNMHKFLLEGNDISYIAPRVFSNFSQLDDIILKKNNISYLAAKVFDNTSVSTLDLSYNHLSNISTMFDGLKVTKLNLSNNEITNIDENTFGSTTFWTGRQWRSNPQQLDLSYNFISKIYPNTFKSNNSDILRSLFLQHNQLTTLDNNTFIQLKYLRFLTLEENYILELYTDSFKGLTNLNTLILKNNQLEKIPVSIFADLHQLEFLDLSLNHLTAFTTNTFSGLTMLTKLNISHNNLKVLDDTHIFPLGKLISLDISDTKLKEINLQAILEHHYKLRVLIINDNFWSCKQLVQMYRAMNERIGGFDYPAHHYDVPNLHGIACSRNELDSYNDMTFDDFLGVIAQDRIFEDLYDSKMNNDQENLIGIEGITNTIKSINGMFYMLLLITFIIIILFITVTAKCVCQYLYRRNTLPSKFSFMYAPNQDNVELI